MEKSKEQFAAPVPNDPWSGVLNATADKESCTQALSLDNLSDIVGSEDCLYINIYTTN
ncbi:hypothetical protein GWI33_021746, partial [Rhynchophorus ferrugineus]